MRIGVLELVIIVIVVLLLFGKTLIPKIFKTGTESIKTAKHEFDSAKDELSQEFNTKDNNNKEDKQ